MNKICIAIFFAAISINVFAQNTIVEGTLFNPGHQAVMLKYYSNKPNGQQDVHTTMVDQNGNFTFDFYLDQYVEAFIYNGREYVGKVILEPGENINVQADLHNLNSSLYFKGEKAAKSNFWTSFAQAFPEFNQKTFYYKPFSFHATTAAVNLHRSGLDENTYFNEINRMHTNYIDYLFNFSNNDYIDEYSKDKILSTFKARALNDKILYYYLEQSILKNTEIPFDFEQEIENQNTQTLSQLDNKEYVNAMKAQLAYYYIKAQKSGPKTSSDFQYETISEKFIGPIKYYLQTILFSRDFNNKNITLWEQKRNTFLNENPYEEWTFILENQYNKLVQQFSNIASSDFALQNDYGQTVSSSEFFGSVVYISFWATWCKPCLNNFTKNAELKKKYEEQGVVFININIDKDRNKANQKISELNISGINLFTGNSSEITKITTQFGVDALPAYFLLDKMGNLSTFSGNLTAGEEEIKKLLNY